LVSNHVKYLTKQDTKNYEKVGIEIDILAYTKQTIMIKLKLHVPFPSTPNSYADSFYEDIFFKEIPRIGEQVSYNGHNLEVTNIVHTVNKTSTAADECTHITVYTKLK
jgi:hypothetical protein